MPAYKIIYANSKGRAELTRLTFAAGGIAFEDKRLAGEEWPKLKPDTPLGQMPLLCIDDEMYPQSGAMARFAASKAGLKGKDDIEEFRANVIVETCGDLMTAVVSMFFEKDETKKGELRKKAVEETVPRIFSFFQKKLEAWGKDSGFFLQSGLSWADLAVFDTVEKWTMMDGTCLDKFPKLAAHSKKVKEVPKIAEYLKKRPVTEH